MNWHHILVTLLVIFSLNRATAAPLEPSDLSVLFPLPQNEQEDLLFRPTTMGQWGELLPPSILEQLPSLNPSDSELQWSDLRVVALRLDPCFPSGNSVQPCLPQIRMIWQPLLKNSIPWTTMDAALHVFYQLPAEELEALFVKIEKLKSSEQGLQANPDLTVHPILAKQGLNGSYMKNLSQLILSATGDQRLTRVTFMQILGQGIWMLAGFDYKNNNFDMISIPRINQTTQHFYNSANDDSYFSAGGAVPAPNGIDTINLLIIDSSTIDPKNVSGITENAIAAARIENPDFHNPNTIDCVSCHTAQMARLWALKNYPQYNLEKAIEDSLFKSSLSLANTSPNPYKTNRLRSFGYDGIEPAISQRVINETAKTLQDRQKSTP